MDRLEKIKGYADRAPREDVNWLIAELTAERRRSAQALDAARSFERVVARQDAELAELRGEVTPPRCPCGFPADHAGWCPRR